MQRGIPHKNLDDSLKQQQVNGPNIVTCPLILKDQEKEKYKHTDCVSFLSYVSLWGVNLNLIHVVWWTPSSNPR